MKRGGLEYAAANVAQGLFGYNHCSRLDLVDQAVYAFVNLHVSSTSLSRASRTDLEMRPEFISRGRLVVSHPDS